MLDRHRIALSAFLLAVLFPITSPPAAKGGDKGVTIDIESEDDASISISLSGGWADDLVGEMLAANLDCDADLDPDTEAMLRHLKRKGPGSRYTLEDDDKTIRARRRKGSWELDVRKDDGTRAEVVLPWALAECLLGDREAMERYRGEGELALVIENDGVVKVRVE